MPSGIAGYGSWASNTLRVIVWPDVYAEHRSVLLQARLLAVHGQWQRSSDGVCNLIAQRCEDWSALLGRLRGAMEGSRDFR